eukprot:1195727-Prorocentrum_minimum.AAC.1
MEPMRDMTQMLSEIQNKNEVLEKQMALMRQELGAAETRAQEAQSRVKVLEQEMENKISQNQLIAKNDQAALGTLEKSYTSFLCEYPLLSAWCVGQTGPVVESLLMEKLKGSYREFEMSLREKMDEQIKNAVTKNDLIELYRAIDDFELYKTSADKAVTKNDLIDVYKTLDDKVGIEEFVLELKKQLDKKASVDDVREAYEQLLKPLYDQLEQLGIGQHGRPERHRASEQVIKSQSQVRQSGLSLLDSI